MPDLGYNVKRERRLRGNYKVKSKKVREEPEETQVARFD